MTSLCYCGSNQAYADCCEPYLCGRDKAPSAESLMRSRYTAFVTAESQYLLDSWHLSTRPSRLRFDDKSQWLGLTIKKTVAGNPQDDVGEVEFIARFRVDGKAVRLHERSRFVKEDEQWFYVDGDHL
ncbi:MAG: SEC-C motif-containing protein [Gammaproteobacteria bacterium]|jgi:SEC-C motif-containing protein